MTFYFTFGCGQMFEGGYYIVEAENETAARAEMMRIFSNKWSMQYESKEAAGVEMYGLYEVVLSNKQISTLGQLRDLLDMESGLRSGDVEWIEKFSKARELTPRIVQVIDDIYERCM